MSARYIKLLLCIKKTTENQLLNGAGSGNRTHLASLEGWSITDIRYLHKLGADEGSRTPTPKALDPKSSASANFATPAFGGSPGNRTRDTMIKSHVLYRLS